MADNPLTDEQIKRINEIAQLPPEEQQKELQEFLKTLNPEQIEFLKKQQAGSAVQCPFCLINEGKLEAKKVYADDYVMAVMDINPATPGHVLLFPRKHYQLLFQMSPEEISHLFNVANKLSVAIFEAAGAEGSNLFVALGAVAGQKVPHVLVHIIPRKSGDGLKLEWEGKKLDEKEMDDVYRSIVNKVKDIFSKEEEVVEEEVPKDFVEEERIPR